MNVVKSALLDESYYEYDHPSGLKILVYPKEGYQSAYAIFGTRYGSIDTRFRLKGEQEWTVVPEGIAHFLEHKLFESQDEDAFARYARTGANANAFTSFDRTCYLFSCTENFSASLGNPAGFRPVPLLYQGNGGQRAGHHRPGNPYV